MKRLFAILLVLVLVVPMYITANAETAEEKPFYFMNISPASEELTNIYPLTFAYTSFASVQNGDAAWASIGGTKNIPQAAQKLKEDYDKCPEGTRYMRFDLPQVAFHTYAEDVIYVDKSIDYMIGWMEDFFSEYHSIGGKIDGLVIDIEFENLYATYIHSRFFVNDPLVYDKIVKNPLYATHIRPQLEERGFKFYPDVTEYTPEIYSIHPNSGDEYAQSRVIWDTVVRNYINQSVTEVCQPFLKYYPNGVVTDYQSKNTLSWLKELDDSGGVIGEGGNYTKAGNSNCENSYSVRLGTNFYVDYYTKDPAYTVVPGYNRAIMDETPFVMFQHDTNIFKNTYLASENGNISFWIAHHMYNLESKNSVSMTPYYTETLIHMALLNPQVLLGYIVPTELEKPEDYDTAMQIVDDIMKELTRVVGYADRKPLDVVTDWNSKFVLSGMYAGGSNYYRITPDTNVVSLENFKAPGTADPTFSVNGETVTFPGGEIIADGAITEIGTCGYWIKTPAGVTPTVTREANYWKVYPTFQETYENYAIGTEYTYKNALPTACWEVKKGKDASALIQADPLDANNKVVALKGTYSLKNIYMPENVTAGDSYAEHQAWEVTVQLPADMAADAEVILLNAVSDKKQAVTDGGVKIVGGKLYYDQAGEYVEMPNFTVASDTKYTIVREMNFTNADAITSSYRVYDSAGNLLARAKDIPTVKLQIPVLGINLSCANVAGKAILLDNYKLYPTKVGYDFELYNANTGMKLQDITAKTDTDTAYRFSWLNSTQKEKSYSVVAAYYNGDTLVSQQVIEEVKMAPNEDGVAYGVVEKVDGQTLQIYLKDNNPAEEDEEEIFGGTSGDNVIQPDKNNTVLIIVIVVVAVVVIGTVAVIFLTSSKKKKKTE